MIKDKPVLHQPVVSISGLFGLAPLVLAVPAKSTAKPEAKMVQLEQSALLVPQAAELHRRAEVDVPAVLPAINDVPAVLPLGKVEDQPMFGPKSPPPPTPISFSPDTDGNGRSDGGDAPIRKEDKPKESEIPDAVEVDTPSANSPVDDSNGGNDDKGGETTSEYPEATEHDIPPANIVIATTTESREETPTPSALPETTTAPPLQDHSTTSYPEETSAPSLSRSRVTYPSDTQPAEAHETSTSHTWATITTSTDFDPSSMTTTCETFTHCSTNTIEPYETTCWYETSIPYAVQKDFTQDSKNIGNVLRDTGKLIAVILSSMLISVLLTLGAIWLYRQRKRKARIAAAVNKGADVEGGAGAGKKRKFWNTVGKRKERGGAERAAGVSVNSVPVPEQEVPVPPEMIQRNNQRLSVILPVHSRQHHRFSNNAHLNRTLSIASSLTVPPYPGSLAASGTTRSNSTRTANSVSSNITDDTVVRTKREYQNNVNRFQEQNMHSDHAVVADGFHCAPPNPFDDHGRDIAGAGGMGGSGVGVNGLGEVDGEGNRRVRAHPTPLPAIRIGDAMDPFEDPDVLVADGFGPQSSGLPQPSPQPARVENPFDDGVAAFAEVDVGMGDGFRGYVPGQMGGGSTVERRVSLRGGDARRTETGTGNNRVSVVSSSGSSVSISSSNETLRGDCDDGGGHAGHGGGMI